MKSKRPRCPAERAARLCFCSSKQKIPTEKIDRDLVWLLYSENGKAGQERSDSSCNLTRAQAARTNIYMGGSAVDDSLNASDIGLPSSVCSSVRMGDLDAECYALFAEITLCHFSAPPFNKFHNKTTFNIILFRYYVYIH